MLAELGLKRFWEQMIALRETGRGPEPAEDSIRRDRLLLAGLRIGLRETNSFLLGDAPSYDEFEAWVLDRNGGAIEATRLDRLARALRGQSDFTLDSVLPEPVLSANNLAFWDEHGYVVVKEAVSQAACQAAVNAIFLYAGMSMDDPDSWYGRDLWIPLAHHPALWANRNSSRIHTAFSQIWGRGDLWMDVDVCGVSPPVRPGHTFRGTPLHWDMTLAPPVRFGTQAILYLTRTGADDGAFSCVPGFHKRIETWLRESGGNDPRATARRELSAIPVEGDAGDLIIWRHSLPHAATPNRGRLPRVAQYLNMFPADYEVTAQWL